jgi:predicted protein tyrosine phosphatase
MYIGSAYGTAKETTYTNLQVSHIINCADHEDYIPKFYKGHHRAYIHIAMRDNAEDSTNFIQNPLIHTELHRYLHEMFQSTNDASHKVTLLVHCVYGRSRSVAISILILFLYYCYHNTPKSMGELYSFIGEKRPEIELKREFMNELLKFEALFNNRKSFRDQWLSIFK